MAISIIGIDFAVDPKKTGFAYTSVDNSHKAKLEHLQLNYKMGDITELITKNNSNQIKTLLAIDAPLGWPIDLGEALYGHSAGQAIPKKSDQIFRRETDHFIKNKTGKQSLDVGADRIARTAHSALKWLDELRQTTKQDIPLAWNSSFECQVAAIEVYPAATLKVYGLLKSSGYKKVTESTAREEIVNGLVELLDINGFESAMQSNDNLLDAAVCVVAALDFLNGRTMPPNDIIKAKKEGWIWVRPRFLTTEMPPANCPFQQQISSEATKK